MSFITTAKALTPMFVKTIVRRRRQRQPLSWQEACEWSGSYQDEMINRFRVERAALQVAGGDLLQQTPLLMAARLVGKPDLSVTDFGGATGELGQAFLAAFPQAHYTVVENPTLVTMMQGRSAIQYSTALPESCDIFFSSGTIQYVEDPIDIVRRGMKSARHGTVLIRNSFSETAYYRVQRSTLFSNGHGPIPEGFDDCDIYVPHQSVKESEILSLAQAEGFQYIARLEEYTGTLFGLYGGQYGKQLVFWRQRE